MKTRTFNWYYGTAHNAGHSHVRDASDNARKSVASIPSKSCARHRRNAIVALRNTPKPKVSAA